MELDTKMIDLYINFENGHQLILRSYILSDFLKICENKKISKTDDHEIIKGESHCIDLDINLHGIHFENDELFLTLDDGEENIDVNLGAIKSFNVSI